MIRDDVSACAVGATVIVLHGVENGNVTFAIGPLLSGVMLFTRPRSLGMMFIDP